MSRSRGRYSYNGPSWRVVVVFVVSVMMVVWLIGNRLPEVPDINW